VEATGRFSRRAAFFTDTRLGLALATVRFFAFALADLETLRALPRLADFPLRSFARLGSFRFLRLAMIDPSPWLMWCRACRCDECHTALVTSRQKCRFQFEHGASLTVASAPSHAKQADS
jgi:hypothetical protein